LPDEFGKNFPAFGGFEVEGERALSAIDAHEVDALAVHERRAVGAGVVAFVGVFDFDDVGAEVAQQHRAIRPGQDAGEIDDPNTVEGFHVGEANDVALWRQAFSGMKGGMFKLLAIGLLAAGVAQAQSNVNARTLLERVTANRATKDFSLKARLFVNRDQKVPVEISVKNSPTETRTIYRSGTNEFLVVQPVQGVSRFYLAGVGELTGAWRMQRMLGSQFSYYDLGLPYLHWPDAKVVGEDRLRGRDCYIVEVKAAGEPYSKVKLWIDKEYPALLRTEALDENETLVRRMFITSFKRIGELWIPRGIEAATVLPGALPAEEKSRLDVYEGDYDTKLPAERFAEGRFKPAP
jgi:hypothetical protein